MAPIRWNAVVLTGAATAIIVSSALLGGSLKESLDRANKVKKGEAMTSDEQVQMLLEHRKTLVAQQVEFQKKLDNLRERMREKETRMAGAARRG